MQLWNLNITASNYFFLEHSSRGNRQDIEAIAESMLAKHRAILEPQLSKMLSQIW